jgi:hypothetical protein
VWSATPGFEHPLCGHAKLLFISEEECQMVVKTTKHKDNTRFYFKALHQGCKYRSKCQICCPQFLLINFPVQILSAQDKNAKLLTQDKLQPFFDEAQAKDRSVIGIC